MKNDRVFLAGLAAGAVSGLLVGRRLAAQPHRMPYLDVGQRVLAETRGPVQAALLAARAQARYDELYAHRLRFHQPALRRHLEESILPGLALYQTLRAENDDLETILAEIDRILTVLVERSRQRKLVQIMSRLPDPFAILRVVNRLAIRWTYPPQGWTFEWIEDSDQYIAYDAHVCFYLNVLTAYGAPELTACFCRGDDLLFEHIPGVSWERTGTLGRGDDRCDFRFRRVAREAKDFADRCDE